jgi:hypothetical protein
LQVLGGAQDMLGFEGSRFYLPTLLADKLLRAITQIRQKPSKLIPYKEDVMALSRQFLFAQSPNEKKSNG